MKAASILLDQFFTTNTTFTNEMGLKFFPLVANEGTDFPFATYRIEVVEGESKDADKTTATIALYYDANSYTECVTFSDTVENLIKNKFDWISSTVDFFEADQSFVALINFEII